MKRVFMASEKLRGPGEERGRTPLFSYAWCPRTRDSPYCMCRVQVAPSSSICSVLLPRSSRDRRSRQFLTTRTRINRQTANVAKTTASRRMFESHLFVETYSSCITLFLARIQGITSFETLYLSTARSGEVGSSRVEQKGCTTISVSCAY